MKRGKPAMAASQLRELKKEAKATPPSEIFVEVGKQLSFYVPPCQDGARLRTMVREGGGCLVEKPTEHVINIIPEGSPPAGDRTAVSSRFILDSVANGQLQKVKDYIVYKKKAAGILGADGAGPREGKVKAERKKFTAEDDAALIRWVKSNPGLRPQGRELWERAQRAKVTKHSWQSMHNRYRRHVSDKTEMQKPGALALQLAKEKAEAATGKPAKKPIQEKPERKRKKAEPIVEKAPDIPASKQWPQDHLAGVPQWLRKTQKMGGPSPDLSDL